MCEVGEAGGWICQPYHVALLKKVKIAKAVCVLSSVHKEPVIDLLPDAKLLAFAANFIDTVFWQCYILSIKSR